MKRLQHKAFGNELRELLDKKKAREDQKALAGIIVSEIDHLVAQKLKGERHQDEKQLQGTGLSEIHYLQLYRSGNSIRVYFTTINGSLWMLLLDPAKRRQDVDAGTKESLLRRLADVKVRAAEAAKLEADIAAGRAKPKKDSKR